MKLFYKYTFCGNNYETMFNKNEPFKIRFWNITDFISVFFSKKVFTRGKTRTNPIRLPKWNFESIILKYSANYFKSVLYLWKTIDPIHPENLKLRFFRATKSKALDNKKLNFEIIVCELFLLADELILIVHFILLLITIYNSIIVQQISEMKL